MTYAQSVLGSSVSVSHCHLILIRSRVPFLASSVRGPLCAPSVDKRFVDSATILPRLMSNEPSKKCKSVQSPAPMDLRLKLEISELLSEVNEYLWQYHGRPQYIMRKLQWCPWTILKDDLDQTKALLDRAPNLEQMAKCRQLVAALQTSPENKNRVTQLEHGMESVKKVKEHLTELVARVQSQLASTAGNISPTLSSVKASNKVRATRISCS